MFGQIIGDLLQGGISGVMGGLGEGAGKLLRGFTDAIKPKEEEGEGCEENCQGQSGCQNPLPGQMPGGGTNINIDPGMGGQVCGSQTMRGLNTAINIAS